MTVEQTANPGQNLPQGRFDRFTALRSIGASLIFNALCPYLLYRFLAPHFPAESIRPLLYSTIFPIVGFFVGLVRKRSLDAVALIALFSISAHVTLTILSSTVAMALVLRSFTGAIIGSFFVLSALVGRPVILYIARQFVQAGSPDRLAGFDRVVEMDKRRVFRVTTSVWGIGLIAMSGVHVALALYLSHADYLLASPALGVVVDVVLLAWSGQYIFRRISAYIPALQSSP